MGGQWGTLSMPLKEGRQAYPGLVGIQPTVMQDYVVDVVRTPAGHALAETRSFHLDVGAHRGDPTVGFNPVETLLSALSACLMTSLAMVSEMSRVPVERMRMTVRGTRQDKPPVLVAVQYHLVIDTDLPAERIDRLIDLAQRNSTVFQTLSLAVPVSGTWEIQPLSPGLS